MTLGPKSTVAELVQHTKGLIHTFLSRRISCKLCQNYTEQYKGAAAHTVTTRLQVRKGEMQVEDGDYEGRRETSSSFVFLHSNPCIIIGYKQF